MPQKTSRREFLGIMGASVFASEGGLIDEDGDGDYLDDLLGWGEGPKDESIWVGLDEERDSVDPEDGRAYFAIDTGAFYKHDNDEWRLVPETGQEPELSAVTFRGGGENRRRTIQFDGKLDSLVVVKHG